MEITLGYVVKHPEVFGATNSLVGVYDMPVQNKTVLSVSETGAFAPQAMYSEFSIAYHIVPVYNARGELVKIYFAPPGKSRQQLILGVKEHSWAHGYSCLQKIAKNYNYGNIKGVPLSSDLFGLLPEHVQKDAQASWIAEPYDDDIRFVTLDSSERPNIVPISNYVPMYADWASKGGNVYVLLEMPKSMSVDVNGGTVQIIL